MKKIMALCLLLLALLCLAGCSEAGGGTGGEKEASFTKGNLVVTYPEDMTAIEKNEKMIIQYDGGRGKMQFSADHANPEYDVNALIESGEMIEFARQSAEQVSDLVQIDNIEIVDLAGQKACLTTLKQESVGQVQDKLYYSFADDTYYYEIQCTFKHDHFEENKAIADQVLAKLKLNP